MRFPKGAAVALLIVCGTELFLHVFEGRLPEPILWGDGEVSVKVAQAQRLAKNLPEGLDLLVLGPSHASVGISPSDMMLLGNSLSVYNGALNGRDFPVLAFVFEQVYLPALQPQNLVIGVNPICFNRHQPVLAHNTAEFFQAPQPRARAARGVEGIWRRFLADRVALYRYRRWEKDLGSGFVNGRRVVDAHGHHAVVGTFDESKRQELLSLTHPYRQVWQDYEFSGPSVEALVRILESAARQGIEVTLINMPFRPELFELPGDGPGAYAKYHDGISEIRQAYGFRWLDFHTELTWDASDFFDADHLNERGARRLSEQLRLELGG